MILGVLLAVAPLVRELRISLPEHLGDGPFDRVTGGSCMLGSSIDGRSFFLDLGREGYVLLERMEGDVPGYLSYGAGEGEVVCVFESVAEAERFYDHWRARIPGEGWGVVRLEPEELTKVLRNFGFISVNPRPEPGTTEYLYTVEDFVKTLRGPG